MARQVVPQLELKDIESKMDTTFNADNTKLVLELNKAMAVALPPPHKPNSASNPRGCR